MGELYIGVMSGTSLDGIDIVLCEIDKNQCKLIASHEYSFNTKFKEEILYFIQGSVSLAQVGELDTKLGVLFADAINSFLKKFNVNPSAIHAIGLHGQTLWHSPYSQYPFSMQLGSPSVVHAQTHIQVVSDFRNMDIANGGQGAPFAPAFHQFLFSKLSDKTAVVNIGGMANITLLDKELQGWDIGAGNVLLDTWIQKSKNLTFDKNGEFAKSGKLNKALLDTFLADPYFEKKAPKSTGREYFNETWIANKLLMFQTIPDEDIQRTLLELTAQTIQRDVEKSDTNLLIICGGGVKNLFLMQRLKDICDCKVQSSDDFDISSDYMEAMAFAWFAYKRIHKEEVNLSLVTGAKKNAILGGIYG